MNTDRPTAKRDGEVRFVQLPHPGPEHEVDESGDRPWLTSKEKHGRPFLVSKAHYRMNLNKENQVGDVAFWGEWEAEAKLDLRIAPTIGEPLLLCRPNPHGKPPSHERGNPQDTDPFVWGECFVYSICRQSGNQKLRGLGRGSLILFGSSVAKKFVIDKVFFVAEWIEYGRTTSRERLGGITSAEHMRAAIEPLCESAGNATFRCYFGATPIDPVSNMYSLVPCKPYASVTEWLREACGRPARANKALASPNKRARQSLSRSSRYSPFGKRSWTSDSARIGPGDKVRTADDLRRSASVDVRLRPRSSVSVSAGLTAAIVCGLHELRGDTYGNGKRSHIISSLSGAAETIHGRAGLETIPQPERHGNCTLARVF